LKNKEKSKELNDIEEIKKSLMVLGFICNSSPAAQHLIYSKNGEVVMIKNRKSKRGEK